MAIENFMLTFFKKNEKKIYKTHKTNISFFCF